MNVRPGSVSFCYAYSREVEGAFMDTFAALCCTQYAWRITDPERGGGVMTAVGTRIASSRNQLVRSFLEGPGEWMMMSDTDHVFNYDAIERLIVSATARQTPEQPGRGKIMGGLCFAGGRSGVMAPTMYRMIGTSLEDARVQVVEDWDRGKVTEVYATGAAFLLVHRDVLESMGQAYVERHPYEWFGEGLHKSSAGSIELGEDWFFCVGARRLGFEIAVDTGVEAPHMKGWVLSTIEWDRYRDQRSRFGEDALKAQAYALRCGEVHPLGTNGDVPTNRAERRRLERAK